MWICEGFHSFGILPGIQCIALYKIPMCQYSKSLWVKTCWDIGSLNQNTGGSGNVEESHKGTGQLLCHLGGGRVSAGQYMCINYLNIAANQVVVGIYASQRAVQWVESGYTHPQGIFEVRWWLLCHIVRLYQNRSQVNSGEIRTLRRSPEQTYVGKMSRILPSIEDKGSNPNVVIGVKAKTLGLARSVNGATLR